MKFSVDICYIDNPVICFLNILRKSHSFLNHSLFECSRDTNGVERVEDMRCNGFVALNLL